MTVFQIGLFDWTRMKMGPFDWSNFVRLRKMLASFIFIIVFLALTDYVRFDSGRTISYLVLLLHCPFGLSSQLSMIDYLRFNSREDHFLFLFKSYNQPHHLILKMSKKPFLDIFIFIT